MPRIPDSDIARLKHSVPLVRLAEARGIILTGNGRNLTGLCPFHDDRTPSLVIDPEQNLWHCLGACQAGGSNLDWVMRDHGVGFRAACEILVAMVGGAAYPARPAGTPERGTLTASSARRLPNPLSIDAEGDVLLGQVADFYHRTLVDNPLATAAGALEYLTARRIGDGALLRRHRIGFCDRSLGLRIPDNARRDGALLRRRLGGIGVVKDSGHEWLFGAVTVPITDPAGTVVGMYGRMTADRLRPGTPFHRYLPGPHRAAWNAAGAVSADGAVILCEALIDALTFAAHGFPHVTAAYGVNGFTPHHRALLTGGTVRTVYLAYDSDDAGDAAAAQLAAELMAAGLTVRRVTFPTATKDANGLAMASADPAAVLGAVLDAAMVVGDGARSSLVPVASLGAAKEAVEPAALPAPIIAAPTAALSPLAAPGPVVPAAAELPSQPAPAPPAQVTAAAPGRFLVAVGDDLCATCGPRRYRIRGLLKNADPAALRIGLRLTVAATAAGDVFHHDTIDLCQAKQRAAFISAAAAVTRADPDAIAADLARLLDACESAWDAHRATTAGKAGPARPALSAAEEAAAIAFLSSPDLLGRIAADYDTCGVVGDAAPKLVSYLCAVSRKLDHPLAVLTMAPSASGKTSLQDGTLAFVPEEDRLCLSAMTGQALHYVEEDLSHRVLAIAEEEGASRAAYSLKLLQSEGRLSLAVPIKDPETGQIATKIKEVRGPVALFLTTTAPQIDDELANRCIVLTVDESADQTARVHDAQRTRETLDGLMGRARTAAVRRLHQNAQRLLDRVAVVNPFARVLSFRSDRPRTRRDHLKYLALIRVITLLHQFQRARHIAMVDGAALPYIETTLDDIAVANHLAAAVLGRSLDDLAPQTRTLLLRLDALVTARASAEARPRDAIRFTRREARDFTGFSPGQMHKHLERLVELEYVVPQRGPQGNGHVYQVVYDGQGQAGEPFLLGLADVATIRARLAPAGLSATPTTPVIHPPDPRYSPPVHPAFTPVSRPFHGHENGENDGENRTDRQESSADTIPGRLGGLGAVASYRTRSDAAESAPLAAAPVGLPALNGAP